MKEDNITTEAEDKLFDYVRRFDEHKGAIIGLMLTAVVGNAVEKTIDYIESVGIDNVTYEMVDDFLWENVPPEVTGHEPRDKQ